MISSITAVRTIIGQAKSPTFIRRTISSPRSPTSFFASGSRKIASGRALSITRY
jgi:hypothetical protein